MKRNVPIKKLILITSLLGGYSAEARYLLTQLPGLYGRFYYPVELNQDNNNGDWCMDWKVGAIEYARNAFDAYPNCDTTCKVPWSHLIFDATSFPVTAMFENAGQGISFGQFALAGVSVISPRYTYDEAGAIFTLEMGTSFECCDAQYNMGLRAFLPVRDIQVADLCQQSDISGVELADVFQTRTEQIGNNPGADPNRQQTNVNMYAIRLDFLSQLTDPAFVNPGQPGTPILNYHNASNNIQIGGIGGVNIGAATNDTSGAPSVAVLATTDGVMPFSQRWGDRVNPTTNPDGTPTIGVDTLVAANGSGVAVGQRGVFTNSINYTPLSQDPVAQSTLFVVPILQGGAGTTSNTISTGGLSVLSIINQSLGGQNFLSLQDFLSQNGLNFCEGRTKGLGDLDVNFYINRNWGCDKEYWSELLLGVRFPTAKKLYNCLNLVQQPLGNDGHFEIRGGLSGGWDARDWVKFMADATFVKVLSHNERVAAPFKGATVANIGPCINAKIDWWYFVGHLDATFFATDCCGFDLGYELYYQGQYKVNLCQSTATDFLGNTNQPLDASILERSTKRIANKVRTAFFTNIHNCTITMGWTQVFAGKNIGRETDWYLNFEVRF